MFTNSILLHRHSPCNPRLLRKGAASLRRMLGCERRRLNDEAVRQRGTRCRARLGRPRVAATKLKRERERYKQAVEVCLTGVSQPNGMRVSCGATLERSQTDGLHRRTAPTASRAC